MKYMKWIQATLFGALGNLWFYTTYAGFYGLFDINPKMVPIMNACKPEFGAELCAYPIYFLLWLSEIPILLPLYFVFALLFTLTARLFRQIIAPSKILLFGFFVLFNGVSAYYGMLDLGWHTITTPLLHISILALSLWLAHHLTRTLNIAPSALDSQ